MRRYIIKRYALRGRAFALLLTCAAAAYSQSPLALQFPLGLPDVAGAGQSAAMAGGGVAAAEEYFGAALNPANAAVGKRSAFSALVTFDLTMIGDNGELSTVSRYEPKLISLVLPIGVAGNVSLTMQSRYDAGLNYYTEEVVPVVGALTQTNTIELQNSGGMTAWQAGWAYRLKSGLSFGVAYERLFYNHDTRNTFRSVFEYDVSNRPSFATSARETATAAFASDGIRAGVQIPISEKITVASTAEYVFLSDNGTIRREYRRDDAAVPIGSEDGTFEIRLPPSMTVGLAYKLNEHWLMVVDARSTFWGMYESAGAADIFGAADELRQTMGVSVGGRHIPAAGRLVSKYWEKMHYGAGIKYDMLPRTTSHEYGVSAGIGLPIPNGGGLIDLVVEYERRTDTRYSKYSENSLKFHLGINGGRDWFQDAPRR